MASNESLETSPSVVRAISTAFGTLHRYPDPLATTLRRQLGELHGIDERCVLVGSGSDELMFLLATAYASAGGSVLCADPGYWGHEFPARIAGADIVKVPLAGWTHDLQAMEEHAVDIAFVCNPHNPTGTVVEPHLLDRFMERSRARLVVVDEAYIDFADDPSGRTAIPSVSKGRVAVLRTMSKFYGLAGLRVGYLVAPSDVVVTLVTIRQPFSVNHLAQVAAGAALNDHQHLRRVRERTLTNRDGLRELFETAGYDTIPSQANFILVLADDEAGLLSRLETAGVVARPGSDLGIPGAVRVTVPTEEGLAMVARALV